MDSSNGTSAIENQSLAKQLRLELKEWEQSFSSAHQGRKAGRGDIKQHPEIAYKYKQYDRLRGPSSRQPTTHIATPLKKRSTSDSGPFPSSQSPSKRPKHTHLVHPAATHSFDPSSPQHLPPRTLRTSIGPTPQKDGQVLGLFDQLSAASSSQTPSKPRALQSVESNMLATPSRRPRSKDQTGPRKLHPKSPLSGAKSIILHELLTPLTRRTKDCSTPAPRSAVSNLRFEDTPAFLRRDSQRVEMGKENILGDEEGVSWSPVAMRKVPRAAGRALSALVRGLREMEDEELDEELDMLRETESQSASRNCLKQPKVFANNSQRPNMLLGADGGIECESGEDGVKYTDYGKGKDGNPLKVWKKKGQKRTTRRVLMKPNTARWKPEPVWKVGQADGADEDDVAETQTLSANRSSSYAFDSDNEDINRGQEAMRVENVRDALDKTLEEKDSAKSVKKKISATAHANFRALHIKNKMSKLKKSVRFGRKR